MERHQSFASPPTSNHYLIIHLIHQNKTLTPSTMAVLKASVFYVLFALATLASATAKEASSSQNALKEDPRTIFLDAGSTDEFGITDVFLYIGTFTLAVLTALVIIGIIYGANESKATGYEATAATGYDTYTAYDQAYQVARSLYAGYKKYEEDKAANL